MQRGVMRERSIIHINIIDYMAQIEVLRDVGLSEKPFVVGLENVPRSVVQNVSHIAYQEGIRQGMSIKEAQRKVKGLLVVRPRPDQYKILDSEVTAIASSFTPTVEPAFRGHCFLDVQGSRRLFGAAVDCAAKLRADIVDRIGVKPSIALSVNKTVSKVGSRVVRPYGFTTIHPGSESSYLSPQDISMLPGVGQRLFDRFAALNVKTIGEFAQFTDSEVSIFGPRGYYLRDRARGIDEQELILRPFGERSLKKEIEFSTDSNDAAKIGTELLACLDSLGFVLRRENLESSFLSLSARYTDGLIRAFSHRFCRGTFLTMDFVAPARELLGKILDRRVRLRSLEVSLGNLVPAKGQIDLFIPEEEQKRASLQKALDAIKARYGERAVCAAILL